MRDQYRWCLHKRIHQLEKLQEAPNMCFGVWVRSTEVADLRWPCGVERWCAQLTRIMCGPKQHQKFVFVPLTSRIFAIKHGFVGKSAWGCSSYDVIAPWPHLTRSKNMKSAQRMPHWLFQISLRSTERLRRYCEKKTHGCGTNLETCMAMCVRLYYTRL